MNENELLNWSFQNVEGIIEKEAEVLKIALCQSYQNRYTDLKTMCKNAGLTPFQAEEVRKWKQNGHKLDTYIFYQLYQYLCYDERERFIRAIQIYKNQNS